MKYNWNEKENRQLKHRRGITFEEIVLCIHEDRIVTVLEPLNKEKCEEQLLYLIAYKQKIYVVPFVINEQEEIVYLHTPFPSRHYTKKYLEPKDEETGQQNLPAHKR